MTGLTTVGSATAAAQMGAACAEDSTPRSSAISAIAPADQPLITREAQEAAFEHARSFEGKDFAEMIRHLKPLAKAGHAFANYRLALLHARGATTGDTDKPENVDHLQACLHFRKAFTSSDLEDKEQKDIMEDLITEKITQHTTSDIAPEFQTRYKYHLKLIHNPTYIEDTIEDPSTDMAGMKALIEDLIQYERPLLEQAEFHAYLHQILNKDIAYLDHMLPLLSLEDKIVLSGHLQRQENQTPYFRVMQAIIDDPTISRQQKAEYQFYRHNEMMKAEILAECASRGVADLDALCKTAEGFKAYQDIFTTFKPTFIKCSKTMSKLKAQDIVAREDDMISKPIKNTIRMYRDYKEAIRAQEVQAMVQQMMAAGADKVARS